MRPLTRAVVVRFRAAVLLAALPAFTRVAAGQTATRPPTGATASSDLASLDLEQLLRLEVVVGASKRIQRSREVPSYVTVISASDIKQHDYQTLADVLKAIPSFYVTNDRNYSYVGVRGFDRPGDYSSRVLLLVNGLRTNDNVYDQAYIGNDFGVDLSLVDRVEIIRGPSAAIYGSNAFFAVINVVTKKGRDIQGAELSGVVGSYGTRSERASFGRSFQNGVDLLASATYSDSKGQSLYFKEFDAPETNNGWADNVDYENFHKLFASVTKGGLSFETLSSSRKKGIPTGSFETRFNDPRTSTVDALTLASVKYDRAFATGGTVSTRAHFGRWYYSGRYAYDSATPPENDDAVGRWWGVDLDATQSWSRHFVTAGVEYRDNFQMEQ
jgi:outer membrane receptor protein involved in Fe transport